jgi:hypothetical protein
MMPRGTIYTNLVVARHVAVHRFPLATPAELRRRSFGDGVGSGAGRARHAPM